MLRRQNPNRDPMSFLAGASEMAGRIRNFDWDGHPLGTPESWPQSLRSALGICLNSAFPTAIYWGSELRLLYNDAWSKIPGPRHPGCLGERAEDVWADIWHVIEPQFTTLIESGQGLFFQDQHLPMRRYGYEEETYWNYSFTPIRGEDGAIEGVFNSGNETTENVLKRRQTEFLLSLTDALRLTSGPEETMPVACRELGQFFDARRVGIREFSTGTDQKTYPVIAEWTAAGVEKIGDAKPFQNLGRIAEELNRGHVAVVNDIADIDDDAARSVLRSLGAVSALAVPWTEGVTLQAVLFVHLDHPWRWTDEDVATVEKVLERTMIMVDRARTLNREKTMMREIDHRARNLLAIVRALVRLNHAGDVDSYKRELLGRLSALAKTHSLLSEANWSGVTLRDVLEDELAPFRTDLSSIAFEGPPVALKPETAQSFAMVFHELATNAAKYGAFAEAGRLRVDWTLSAGGILDMHWSEASVGMPPDGGPGEGTGFGSNLISHVVRDQLRGRIERSQNNGSLRYDISVTLDGVPSVEPAPPRAERADREGPAPRRILVVEDDPILALDLSDTLEGLGYEVVASSRSVASALSMIEAASPEIAVLDVNLGKETSEPVAEELIARGVPFLQLTGDGAEADARSVFANRPRLMKPYSESELETRLRDLVSPPQG